MSKPASLDILNTLHAEFIAYLVSVLRSAATDSETSIPLDAATMGVIAKVLKDNDIGADPADRAALDKLREEFSKSRQGVTNRASNIVGLARQDDGPGDYPLQ